MKHPHLSLDIDSLHRAYREGRLTPAELIDEVLARIAAQPDRHEWIRVLDRDALMAHAARLEGESPDTLPLYGIPFAIKDNIDLAGVPTTAACPAFAYTPEHSAFVVERLIEAGALPIGKTNLDQFATGLVGTRSPYGACANAFDPAYISGGSSAGSAVTVATGVVSFSLGTDTAGSGRVPAAFNNLIGVKPTRGLLSASGVVPACRSLDTVSIFALTVPDAERVLAVTATFDTHDAYARPRPLTTHGFDPARFRFGVPRAEQLQFFGNAEAARLFREAVARLQSLGGTRVELDFAPFLDAARLLYEGPWVTERYLATQPLIDEAPGELLAVTRGIIGGGAAPRATDCFRAQYRLMDYKRQAEAAWQAVDVLVTPTAGTIYTIAQVNADPVRLNSNLGYYTNFMNLLDLASLAVPAGFQADGLPFGITLIAPAFGDGALLPLGERFQHASVETQGATAHPVPAPRPVTGPAPGHLRVAVCGAHMQGLPLNHQLTERGARLVAKTRTSPHYRFYALAGGPPWRPGLVRDAGGQAIEVEVWELPAAHFGSFVDGIPAPLGIGRVELADGSRVAGFLCEPHGVADAREITHLGGWRAYLGACRTELITDSARAGADGL
ncbi:allophanate hydrolase [Thioalkalivibrio sulfidiphilus]|uniref:allophanate hydrolase n=1 Tax=Thioalkalivibrio sulfidiphilus TaxID=1033854 RepID=UPI003BB1131E